MNSDHKNEIEEIKQNFQKLIEENNVYLKQKDEKINYLEEIKKVNYTKGNGRINKPSQPKSPQILLSTRKSVFITITTALPVGIIIL